MGVVQGLTEFLPISSSGHLVFFQNLLGFREPELFMDISLHLGTLLAVCLYFRSDLLEIIRESVHFVADFFSGRTTLSSIKGRPHVLLLSWVVVGTIPTALIGIVFRSPLEHLFGNLT